MCNTKKIKAKIVYLLSRSNTYPPNQRYKQQTVEKLKKKFASLFRICHMVYDFQAGGFLPLINPVAINKSTKQQESPYGETRTHYLRDTVRLVNPPLSIVIPTHMFKKTVKRPPIGRWRNSRGFAFLAQVRQEGGGGVERVLEMRGSLRGVLSMCHRYRVVRGRGLLLKKKMVTLKLQAITSLTLSLNFHLANENIYVFVI